MLSSYKDAQVKYKSLIPKKNWWEEAGTADLVDFSRPSTFHDLVATMGHGEDGARLVYLLREVEGFVYIPQALSSEVQLDLSLRCLATYCSQYNSATNIDGNPAKINASLDQDESSKSMSMFEKFTEGTDVSKHSHSLETLSW